MMRIPKQKVCRRFAAGLEVERHKMARRECMGNHVSGEYVAERAGDRHKRSQFQACMLPQALAPAQYEDSRHSSAREHIKERTVMGIACQNGSRPKQHPCFRTCPLSRPI